MTYSIVARDPATGDLGVAVQSHFFGVGRVVGWARPGAGVVATQAFAEVAYGPQALALMEDGLPAAEALARLVAADHAAPTRQVAAIDVDGRTAIHTGATCVEAAGHAVGDQVVAQGNMLANAGVWPAMLAAYEAHDGDLTARLLAALDAGEGEGGDIRGRQSAAILVVRAGPAERPWEAVRVDCRVDDHPEPLVELRRLVALNGFYDRFLALLSEEGVLGGPLTDDGAALDRALDDLAAGRRLLGGNQEATFWRGVLLARLGDEHEAREHFAAALAVRPELGEFLRRMAPGVLPGDAAAVLARVLPGVPAAVTEGRGA